MLADWDAVSDGLCDAEGWHYALTWNENAGALVEIAQAAQPLAVPGPEASRALRAEAARSRSPHAGLLPGPAPAPTSTVPAAVPIARHQRPGAR
ncbi:hypothetical protein ABT354_17085 [Streptomyces sp. NPDC000594]|uniref:hypothetical protein n=1 Tax=Streptomyces sp. NPDC000594 TaxID=3154261 RepID=UPI0033312E3A